MREEGIMSLVEEMIAEVFAKNMPTIPQPNLPFPRLNFAQAMEKVRKMANSSSVTSLKFSVLDRHMLGKFWAFSNNNNYHIALTFRGSKFSQFSRIQCHSRKYFNENFDTSHHRLFLVTVQRIREIF